MFNWNVDEERFKKEDPKGYRLWRLTQLINYGLSEGEKLDKKEVIKAWPMIKENIDPYIARLVEYLIWGKLYSLPPNITFWNWPPKRKK
ncbi:hypothetical protein HY945_00500 [Candidatus Gottesmanbacteria bacterium]|nr:hypothetical protein [Candidatus Gottesmanbacteria bacterium]